MNEEKPCNCVAEGVWEWTFRNEYVQSQDAEFLSTQSGAECGGLTAACFMRIAMPNPMAKVCVLNSFSGSGDYVQKSR